MATLALGGHALADLDRVFDLLAEHDPALAARVGEDLVDALEILTRHPLIGWPVEGELREMVISSGRGGHVALYRYVRRVDRVEVLALRHQREAGYG